jgi:hypothetical protein
MMLLISLNRRSKSVPAFDDLRAIPVIKYLMNNNSINIKSHVSGFNAPKRERGVALIIGLLLLLVLTIMGIAAMRSTGLQERMSANNQQQMITFQGAEAGIRQVMESANVAPTTAAQVQTVDVIKKAVDNGKNPAPNVLATTAQNPDTGNGTTNVATIEFKCNVPLEGNSLGLGTLSANYFLINSSSTQNNTNSSSVHQQTVIRQGGDGTVACDSPPY